MSRPALSVIMVAHNQAPLSRRAIAAALPDLRHLEAELIFIDQASADGSALAAAEAAAGRVPCRVLEASSNRPWALAANSGARRAEGEFLLFLDNDTALAPGALLSLRQALQADPSAAAIGPKLLYPSGHIEQAGLALPLWLIPVHVGENARGDDHRFNFPRSAFAVSTSCMLVRHQAFDEVGGFDEGYVWGYESADLCQALRQKGHRVLYEPRASCSHDGGATLRGNPQLARTEDNRRRFLERWGADLMHRVSLYLDRLCEDGHKDFLIYGTGESGQHLAQTLEIGGYAVRGFLTPNGMRAVGPYPAWNVADAPHDEASRVLIGSPDLREAEDALSHAGLLAGAAMPILME